MKTALKQYFQDNISFDGLGYRFEPSIKAVLDIEMYQPKTHKYVREYMQGLPSWFNGFFYTTNIISLMRDCGYKSPSDKLDGMYWDNLASYVLNEYNKEHKL
jgi:hypothetical protein